MSLWEVSKLFLRDRMKAPKENPKVAFALSRGSSWIHAQGSFYWLPGGRSVETHGTMAAAALHWNPNDGYWSTFHGRDKTWSSRNILSRSLEEGQDRNLVCPEAIDLWHPEATCGHPVATRKVTLNKKSKKSTFLSTQKSTLLKKILFWVLKKVLCSKKY